MTTVATHPHLIGELCLGGDWACAHGDFSALRDIARRLSSVAHEPMHCALIELADTCVADPDRASRLWVELKHTVLRAPEW
jgi:hypothetical protein